MQLLLPILCLGSAMFTSSEAVDTKKALFIGNSYTYRHSLKDKVKGLADHGGHPLEVWNRTVGGWWWRDHDGDATTTRLINERKYDYVVLQDKSTGMAANIKQDVCPKEFPHANSLVNKIRQKSPEATIIFYDTWGRSMNPKNTEGCVYPKEFTDNKCTFEGMQGRNDRAYEAFACLLSDPEKADKTRVAPVGPAFREYKSKYGKEAFYALYKTNGEADHHPSLYGTYTAACAIYSSMFGARCTGNTYHSAIQDNNLVQHLQEAADNAINEKNWKATKGCEQDQSVKAFTDRGCIRKQ